MEAPVLLLAKKVKQCHTFIFDKKQRYTELPGLSKKCYI
jgi:hypothetical protein